MATGLKTIVLPLQTMAGLNVNRKVVLKADYLVTCVSAQAQPFAPEQPTISATATYNLAAGTVISNLLLYVKTPVVGPSTLTCTIGDGSSANRFMATGQDLKAAAGWRQTTLTAYQYIAADTVDITLAGGSALSNVTAGEIEIYFHQADPTDLPGIAQP